MVGGAYSSLRSVGWWVGLTAVYILSPPFSYPPFFDEHPFRIYEKILEGKVSWPVYLSPTSKDLIKKLLVRDVTRRLGSLKVCNSMPYVFHAYQWVTELLPLSMVSRM